MADTQSLRQIAQSRTPFSAWLGVVVLFALFGVIVLALVGPSPRGDSYEQKRAKAREEKLKTLHEQDAKALTTYGWIDKNKGLARIPIDRAMQLTLVDLAKKKPAPAGPIATPAPPATTANAGVAAPSVGAPTGSPAPSGTPRSSSVQGHEAAAQPAAGTNPPGAAPGTQPGPAASPAASAAPAAIPPVSPSPANIPTPPGSPLPVRGKSPGGT
ncbi:MAG: hypothetical protein JWO45_19 [Spartobacteria bacterium]|nr:hypothetical protein [Spartobacteria bacterium]